jgi:hypothetical protein
VTYLRLGSSTCQRTRANPVLRSAVRSLRSVTTKKSARYHLNRLHLRLISFTNFNAQFLYSLTICMLHYNPQHVSSINMPIFRRANCIIFYYIILYYIILYYIILYYIILYYNMYVTLQSSTCFEHQHAHLQEDKLYYIILILYYIILYYIILYYIILYYIIL